MSLNNILAVMRSEALISRRLIRFWIFQFLGLIVVLMFYGFYAFGLHYFTSSYSATAAMFPPRFLMSFIGAFYVYTFQIFLIFMAFDVRARDDGAGIGGALDARPFSNMELLIGRLLGLLRVTMVSAVVSTLVVVLIGLLTGQTILPQSLVTFLVFMAIPSFTLAIGLTFFLTILTRHRLVAALLALALLIALPGLSFFAIPLYLQPMFDLSGQFALPFQSDIVMSIIEGYGATQRLGVLLIGLAFLPFAAAIHPRKDDSSRPVLAGIGVVLLLAGLGTLYSLVRFGLNDVEKRRDWQQIHAAVEDEPVPDLERIGGRVRLVPGRRIELDLQLDVAAPADAALQTARFSFNPGMKVESVDGGSGGFSHENGLLEIPVSLQPGQTMRIGLKAVGQPDRSFAYLDAAFEPMLASSQDVNIVLMGFEPIMNRGSFVALMPGARWLPRSGPEPQASADRRRVPDFHHVDIEVEVPDGWLVAGPGKREGSGGSFRFAPSAPVPQVALIAAKYERRELVLDDVTLELLYHRKHQRNIEFFEEADEEIEAWLRERFDQAEAMGLGYPYRGLSLVEVPNALRGWGGGWRMDSTYYQPGMVLMRESGFPTARFDAISRKGELDGKADEDGGVARAKREMLEDFFEYDFSGGNPFLGAARGFFSYQTAGVGREGIPLDYVYETLSNQLIMEKQSYFSVHHFDAGMNDMIQGLMVNMALDPGGSAVDALRKATSSRREVWDAVREVQLAAMDPWENPERSVDVLSLKGEAMARSLLDTLGRDSTAAFMADLRERAVGRPFTRDDVIASGEAVGADLGPWLDAWLHQTALPGFTYRDVESRRIADAEDGTPRYQVVFTLQNDEEVSGLIRVVHRLEGKRSAPIDSEPIRIEGRSALRIGVLDKERISEVRVEPYLSLNQGDFVVPFAEFLDDEVEEIAPVLGAEPTEWLAKDDSWIIVDDLDPGFQVVDEAPTPWWQRGDDEDSQGELAVVQPGPRAPVKWSRLSLPRAYGRYRHTLAVVREGKGLRRAIFEAELPRAGEYELELFMPPRLEGRSGRRGSMSMQLVDPSGSQEIPLFDAEKAQDGWNPLGRFDVASGKVRVEISNETDGRLVLADAIRWRPVRRGGDEVASAAAGQ